MKKKSILTLITGLIILSISGLINIWGIKWGLPNHNHLYSFHPDEGINIGGALNIFMGNPEPGFYNYSSLYFYITSYIISYGASFGFLHLKQNITPETLASIYLCGRITSVIFTTLTTGFVFWTAYRIKGLKSAIISSLIFATLPIIAMHTKFVSVDCTCGFFVTLCIFISTFIPKENITLKNKKFSVPFLLSCVAAGLAMGTKYNGLIVFIVPLCILISLLIQKKISIKDFILIFVCGGLLTIITFLITTPGIFLNTKVFIKDFTYELHHMKIGHGDEFTNTGFGPFYSFYKNMFWGMGRVLSCLSIICLIFGIFNKNNLIKSISIFILIFFISISMGNVRFARYLIPVLGAFSIITGFILCELPKIKCKKIICAVLLLLSIIPNIILLSYIDSQMNKKDQRDLIFSQQFNNLKSKTIGLPTVPWFYSLPFIKDTSVMRQQRYELAMNCKDFQLKCLPLDTDEWNVEYLKQEKPEYVIFSSLEAFHKKRTHNHKYEEYINYLNKEYEIVNTRDILLLFGNFTDINKNITWDYPPSDMTYIDPIFYIYHKK